MGKITGFQYVQSSLIGVLCLLAPVLSQAELAFAVQPNAPKAGDATFYQDFADNLTELLGEKVTYLPEKNWSKFRKDLMANEYDIFIAESHITALMTLNTGNGGLDYSVLAAVPDEVKYKVVVPSTAELGGLADLNGKRVCTPISPGLAAVAFLNQYKDDPVNPPALVGSKRGAEQSYQSMLKNRCQAMVLTGLELEKLKMTAEGLNTIFESRSFPGWALNFSPTQPRDRRQLITDLMTSMENSSVHNIYQALSTQPGGFVDKTKDDYVDYNILPGVVWGW